MAVSRFYEQLPCFSIQCVHMSENSFIVEYAQSERSNVEDYFEMVSYLLQSIASNDLIAETSAAIMRHTQAPAMLLTQYAEALVTRSFSCGEFYNEFFLKK